ncbi:uncharacterized protein LOC142620477 [Castanea sativa]|uniref:uncharacterized protein LOC142620477 n=1 Tax=Castanea sativa TaxID=21020 RepID=UPI003F650237
MRQLMRPVEEYKRLEDDQLQNKGKDPVVSNPRQGNFQPRPRKDLRIQEPEAWVGEVNVAFKELVHKIVDRIKHEPYFWWPNKIGSNPSRKNHNLYLTYLKDKGHTTEQCRVLKDHLGQLVKAGYLKEFMVGPKNQETGHNARPRGNPLPPPLGVIEVIHAAPRGMLAPSTRNVLAVALVGSYTDERPPEKRSTYTRESLAFDDDDLKGTIQPHDDAFVVTAWISGFTVKRVMINRGSGADVMYPDLFRGLGLKKEDLSKYDTLLVGFDG